MYLLHKIAKTTSIQVVIGIGSLEDLLKLVFVDKKCRNLKVFINGSDLTRNINLQTRILLQ